VKFSAKRAAGRTSDRASVSKFFTTGVSQVVKPSKERRCSQDEDRYATRRVVCVIQVHNKKTRGRRTNNGTVQYSTTIP